MAKERSYEQKRHVEKRTYEWIDAHAKEDLPLDALIHGMTLAIIRAEFEFFNHSIGEWWQQYAGAGPAVLRARDEFYPWLIALHENGIAKADVALGASSAVLKSMWWFEDEGGCGAEALCAEVGRLFDFLNQSSSQIGRSYHSSSEGLKDFPADC